MNASERAGSFILLMLSVVFALFRLRDYALEATIGALIVLSLAKGDK